MLRCGRYGLFLIAEKIEENAEGGARAIDCVVRSVCVCGERERGKGVLVSTEKLVLIWKYFGGSCRCEYTLRCMNE